MVAVGWNEFDKLHRTMRGKQSGDEGASSYDASEELIPRVINKLTLCFYPGRQVPYNVMKLTGLDNFNLEDQGRFDDRSAQTVREFVGRLAKPVCLVAHNGNK